MDHQGFYYLTGKEAYLAFNKQLLDIEDDVVVRRSECFP
jgi:hypothetical protein